MVVKVFLVVFRAPFGDLGVGFSIMRGVGRSCIELKIIVVSLFAIYFVASCFGFSPNSWILRAPAAIFCGISLREKCSF